MTEPYQPTSDATRVSPGAGRPPAEPQSQPRTTDSLAAPDQPGAVPSEPVPASQLAEETLAMPAVVPGPAALPAQEPSRPEAAPQDQEPQTPAPAVGEAAAGAEPAALDLSAQPSLDQPDADQVGSAPAGEAEQLPADLAQPVDQAIAADSAPSEVAPGPADAVDPVPIETVAADLASTETVAADLAPSDVDDLFRDPQPSAEQTAVLSAPESARLRREERAAARERSLGRVRAAETPAAPPEPVIPFTTPSTYKPFPSLGFLLLRLVIAGVLGIRAWRHWAELALTRQVWDQSLLRNGALLGWVTIGIEIGIAVMLLLGLGTRVAGFLLLAYAVVLLVFVDWGAANIIQPGYFGFLGDLDLVLAVLGLFFITVGGGRAGIDGSIHSGRIQRKNDRLVV